MPPASDLAPPSEVADRLGWPRNRVHSPTLLGLPEAADGVAAFALRGADHGIA